ncbi:MAG: hypothetical protein HN350_00020 [Phycisphaerales bacterium]|jgi:flagellar motor switch protein FliM|nr:hypothetical protein [Phycisphaerales bacterium]
MSQATSKSDQAVLTLLAAVKNGRPAESEQIETRDYDWNVPCCFTPAQLDQIKSFTEKTAKDISCELGEQLHEEVELAPAPLTQHYAGRLALLEGDADSFYFPITYENTEQCGLVVISGQVARQWVSKALGGSEAVNTDGYEFSILESALMRDVVVSIVQALSGRYRMISGKTLQCGPQIKVDEILPDRRSEDEYCLMAFRVDQEDSQTPISFILASDLVAEIASNGITANTSEKTPQNSQEDMLACVEQAVVTATVSLMTVNLSVRQVMGLEIGDVLMSELRIGQRLDLSVGGTTVLSGYPVSSDGQYALQIGA